MPNLQNHVYVVSWVAAEEQTKKLWVRFCVDLEDLGLLPAFGFKSKHRKVHGQNCEGIWNTFVHNYACI